eukprot:2589975-Alexandrium_andersonii.AAC.1
MATGLEGLWRQPSLRVRTMQPQDPEEARETTHLQEVRTGRGIERETQLVLMASLNKCLRCTAQQRRA